MISFGLSPENAQRFAGSLLHFIWQGALLAALTALCLKFMSRRSAEVRYIVSVVSMALMLASPIVTFAFYRQTGALALQLFQLARTIRIHSASMSPPAPETAVWTQWILAAWCAGVVILLARLVIGWYLSRRIVQSSDSNVPAPIRLLFEDIYRRLLLSRPIRLLVQVRIDTPIVVGWLRPVILLPVSGLAGLSEEQLLGIFAHELAHIRRHDFLVNMLQRSVEAVLFYHPAVWWLSNRIRTERENCCDDLAVKICGSRRTYAQALAALEQERHERKPLVVAATGGSLVHRIQRILGMESSAANWQSAAVTLLFLGAWLVAGVWQSPTLVALPRVSAAPVAVSAPPPVSSALNSIAAIITAAPVAVEPAQAAMGPGTIDGIVTRTGSNVPVEDVRVMLSTTGVPSQKAAQDFVSYFASRGVSVALPQSEPIDSQFIQRVLETAASRGIAMVDPAVRSAVMQFQFASSKRHMAITDAAGRFHVEDLPPGKYTIDGGRDDYFDAKGAEAIVVSGKTSTVALSMIPGATIGGRVLNPAGRPMSSARVTAYQIYYENGLPIILPAEEATTDDRGQYRIFWLPPGDYYIGALPHSTLPDRTTSNVVTLSRVDQIIRTYYPGDTDASSAKELKIRGGERLSNIDIRMRTHSGVHRISGFITTSFKAGIANVALVPDDSRTPFEAWNNQNLHVGAIPLGDGGDTGSRSAFDIDGIVPGLYRMIVSVNENNPDGGSGYALGSTTVEVRDRDVPGIQVNISPTVRVSGNVTIDGHSPGKTRVKVSVQADDAMIRVPVYQGLAQRAVIANPDDGAFMVPSVGLGHFRLRISSPLPPEIYVSDIRQGGRSVFDSGFDVTPAPLGTFQVVLNSGAGSVQGAVEDSSGKPLADATVVLVPSPQQRQNRSLYRAAATDAAGHFSISSIAPGEYKVFAWEEVADGAYLNSHFLEAYEMRGKAINVLSSSAVPVTITAILREMK